MSVSCNGPANWRSSCMRGSCDHAGPLGCGGGAACCCAGGGAGACCTGCCWASALAGAMHSRVTLSQRMATRIHFIHGTRRTLPEQCNTTAPADHPRVEADAKRAACLYLVSLAVEQHAGDAKAGRTMPVVPGDVAKHADLAPCRNRWCAAAGHRKRNAVFQPPVVLRD